MQLARLMIEKGARFLLATTGHVRGRFALEGAAKLLLLGTCRPIDGAGLGEFVAAAAAAAAVILLSCSSSSSSSSASFESAHRCRSLGSCNSPVFYRDIPFVHLSDLPPELRTENSGTIDKKKRGRTEELDVKAGSAKTTPPCHCLCCLLSSWRDESRLTAVSDPSQRVLWLRIDPPTQRIMMMMMMMIRHLAHQERRRWTAAATAAAIAGARSSTVERAMNHRRCLSSSVTAATTTGPHDATSTAAAPPPPHFLFDKVLVANRGEIAQRVMRTCRRLGVRTVAIYSTADAAAPFVEMADEAVCVGPPSAGESYLNADAVLRAVQATGAQAVHPGYGFLSENASFCRAVEAANDGDCVFLGPSAHAMEQLGDKLQAKVLAAEAGVTTIPGHDGGAVETVDEALRLCNGGTVPYPVLLKAAAGGGGKGMRVCYNDRDLREAWTVAKAEAIKFFKDDRLLLEKFIENPHHIEFQVLAAPNDNDGTTDVVVFPERECSIQRRNQKIIEETPSVLLADDTRRAMAEQVRRLCQTVHYRSAGTVEFLVDEHQQFYFLEMNTRLQVEHPITEAVTGGIDLVEAMLYVGAGRGLPPALRAHAEGIVPWRGHALEARVYAEDPVRHFLPSTGPLTRYVEPTSELLSDDTAAAAAASTFLDPPYVRLDSGVVPGHNVSPYYDPMISKLVYYGCDRPSAIAGLRRALDEYVIDGVQHNARLVQSVLREPAFLEGRTPTSFLATHYPDGFGGVQLTDAETEEWAVAAAVIGKVRQELMRHAPLTGGGTGGVDGDDDDASTVIVRLGGQFGSAHRVRLPDEDGDSDSDSATVQALDKDGNPASDVRSIAVDDSKLKYEPTRYLATLVLDGQSRTLQVLGDQPTGEVRMQMYGAVTDILLQSPREYELSRLYMREPVRVDTKDMVLSPMPGLLISYAIQPGQMVEEGQELCIVESMKMQNMIRSPRRGVIAECVCDVGASLKVDQVILKFETEDEKAAA